MLIQLTVKKRGSATIASETRLFNPDLMTDIRAKGADTEFYYPDVSGVGKQRYEVDETLTTIASMCDAVSASNSNRKQAILKFDATGGKAVGSYALVDAATGTAFTLPAGSHITRAYGKVNTTFTSAGADAGTIALGVATDHAAGLKAAVAISDGANPWDAGATFELLPDGTVAKFTTLTTGARSVMATVATQALTAGVLTIVVDYVTYP